MKYYLKKAPEQKVPWQKVHDRMFVSYSERHGSAYFEFQYYKKDLPAKKAAKDYQHYWLEDSLYVHMDWQNALMEHYLPYLKEAIEDHRIQQYKAQQAFLLFFHLAHL